MTTLEIISLWQVIFTGIAVIAAIAAAVLAYKIGKRQIEIANFVEVFLMPQQITFKRVDSEETKIKWNILVKNVSSYPIYLNSFTLNGLKQDVGSTAIPHNPDSWYVIPIVEDVQNKGEFLLMVEFEDYLRKKYQSEGSGKFDGMSWNINSKKRVLI